MDPLTQALIIFGKLVDLRILYVQSLSPEKRTQLADRAIDGELVFLDGWLKFLNLLAPKG